MPARIVFADGSKALAHNNDDLYERWVERRKLQLADAPVRELSPFAYIEIFIPELPNGLTKEQIREYNISLMDKSRILSEQKKSLAPMRSTNYELYRDLCEAHNAAARRIYKQHGALGLMRDLLVIDEQLLATKKPRVVERLIQRSKEVRHELAKSGYEYFPTLSPDTD